MKKKVVIYLIVFLVLQSFLFLEEETLILIGSLVWLDAAGTMIREAIRTELEKKGDLIKEKYEWYLNVKKSLLDLLIMKHNERVNLPAEIENLYGSYRETFVENSVGNYVEETSRLVYYEIKNELVLGGLQVVNEILLKELTILLSSESTEN